MSIGKQGKDRSAGASGVEQRAIVGGYRVVYGETVPAWERTFPTKREANAFAKKHKGFGDIIFSIAKVVPGEPPQSISSAIARATGGGQ